MGKKEYKQQIGCLLDGVLHMVDDLKPYLASGGEATGIIMVCTVKTPDGGFTRHMFGGDVDREMTGFLIESLAPLLERIRTQGPCNCPACRAKQPQKVH